MSLAQPVPFDFILQTIAVITVVSGLAILLIQRRTKKLKNRGD